MPVVANPTVYRPLAERIPRLCTILALALAWLAAPGVAAQVLPETSSVVYRIKPSQADSALFARHDEPHYVSFNPAHIGRHSNLLLFLPGTGGVPRNLVFFQGLMAAGYRVISLAYDNDQAIQQICPTVPDHECAGKVRRKRIYGNNVTDLIDDTPSEAIVQRLAALLSYLDRRHPEQDWGRYLIDGAPNWSRIAVSGQSQGAGMAAFIAKDHEVPRVVLFSSPWDNYGRMHILAPWLSRPSATPPERWFATYHVKEKTAPMIELAYAALRIPANHVRVLTMEPPYPAGPNPYHGVGISGLNTPGNFSFVFGSGFTAENGAVTAVTQP